MGIHLFYWYQVLAQDRVQWRALVILALNLRILLPESQLISKMDLREENLEDGKWMELVLLPDVLFSSSPVSEAAPSNRLLCILFIVFSSPSLLSYVASNTVALKGLKGTRNTRTGCEVRVCQEHSVFRC
jgi:hypothetical protein